MDSTVFIRKLCRNISATGSCAVCCNGSDISSRIRPYCDGGEVRIHAPCHRIRYSCGSLSASIDCCSHGDRCRTSLVEGYGGPVDADSCYACFEPGSCGNRLYFYVSDYVVMPLEDCRDGCFTYACRRDSGSVAAELFNGCIRRALYGPFDVIG